MIQIPLDPVSNSFLVIKLYRNVKSVPELRKKIMTGEIDLCFVNPKLILDPLQVVIATNKAVTSENITTRTINTEILFNLSISKNITKSLQQFGITDDCEDLLVLKVVDNGSRDCEFDVEIDGEEVDLDLLAEIRDLSAIKTAYKIGATEEKSIVLLDSVLSRIATKDFVSH